MRNGSLSRIHVLVIFLTAKQFAIIWQPFGAAFFLFFGVGGGNKSDRCVIEIAAPSASIYDAIHA